MNENLGPEFGSVELALDKDALGETIRDWPTERPEALKSVIKARLGNENFPTASVHEALQKLQYWPLDSVTRSLICDLGNADLTNPGDLRMRVGRLRQYYFYLMAAFPEIRFRCMRSLSPEEGASLVRGLTIAETYGYSRYIGSTSLVNSAFAAFRFQPTPVWAELADWVVTHSDNPFIPFNFQRTRHQWEICRVESASPEETWHRVCRAEEYRQRE